MKRAHVEEVTGNRTAANGIETGVTAASELKTNIASDLLREALIEEGPETGVAESKRLSLDMGPDEVVANGGGGTDVEAAHSVDNPSPPSNNTQTSTPLDTDTSTKQETDGSTTVEGPATEDNIAPLPIDESQKHDELVRAAEERISAEINASHPLVGELIDISQLLNEYAADDLIYRQKIHDLMKKYKKMRKTRPDGNCFYRAFLYSYFETLLSDRKEWERFHKHCSGLLDEVVKQGFPRFTLEDFHDTLMESLDKIGSGELDSESLRQTIFNDSSTSDALVVYARVVVSAHLQKEEEFFSSFIDGYLTVGEFCRREVEPVAREADNIHIIAITAALDVSIRVINMDRSGSGGGVNEYDFPEGSTPRVILLYRPGHYDILC